MSTHRTRRLRRAVLLTTAAAALAAPAQSLGATAGVADGELRVLAATGETNSVVLSVENGEIRVEDYEDTPNAGAGCRAVDEADATPQNDPVLCSPVGVTRIGVTLSDKVDSLNLEAALPPVTYSGGAGLDSITYGGGPVTISTDDQVNDGPAGTDDIRSDVEELYGTGASGDFLLGARRSVFIDGGDGDDDLRGGAGNDSIDAASVSGSGEDLGIIYGEGKDSVVCGDGGDQVFVDGDDTVGRDCEVVGKPGRTTSTGLKFNYTGSRKSDRIDVDEFVNAIVKAGAGNDVVRLAADTPEAVIYGEAGNDSLRGDTGEDRFRGGSGNDTIISFTRDNDRDSVQCGSGRDRVIADRADRVSKDCEKVTRKRK